MVSGARGYCYPGLLYGGRYMTAIVTPHPASVTEPRIQPKPAAVRANWWPLALILGVQALLSARLIPSAFVSPDEARYIYAGHQLIHELWHGGGSPYYETYFSGAPDVYPPLAAMADHVGGLIAVRLLCLCFMLAATAILFATTRRLFGVGAAYAAAALFAAIGLTHDIGVYGNYDATAVMFMAAASYCAVRTGKHAPHARRWLLLIPAMLLLANAAKYMTVLFDPVVIGLAAFQTEDEGWRSICRRAAVLGAATAALLALTVSLAGTAYLKGILYTTLNRPVGNSTILAAQARPATFILYETGMWIGPALLMAALSLLIPQQNRKRRYLLGLLTIAGILVTLGALRLHSDESMRQHDDFGAWFTCIAAGYALSVVPQRTRRGVVRYSAAMAAAVAVLGTAIFYVNIDRSTYEGGSGAPAFFAAIKLYLHAPRGVFLPGGYTAFSSVYEDHTAVPWYRLSDDIYIKYPLPGRGGDSHGQTQGKTCQEIRPHCMYLEGPAGFRAAIHAHWFALISLVENHGLEASKAIQQAVEHTPGYVLLTRLGGAPTWIYPPDYRHLPATAHKTKATAQPTTAHHEPGVRTVLRTLAVTLASSAMYLAALLLLAGTVAWQRRRRHLETHPDSRMATRVSARDTAVPAGYPVAGRDPRPTRSAGGIRGPRPPSHEKSLRARVVLPLGSPRLVVVVGCTVGAGQTVTTLMLADMLASLRGEPVAALDLNPGPTSLRELARIPAATASTVLAGRSPSAHAAHLGHAGHPARPGVPARGSRGRGHLDVICQGSVAMAGGTLTSLQHNRLIDILASRYLLTLADPGASELTEMLAAGDQLVLVVPASADAAEAVSMIGEWLRAHGHSALAAHSIAVINGVSQRSVCHAEQAEQVLRGRCRAIVRVPWDNHLADPATGRGIRDSLQTHPGPSRLGRQPPEVQQAYTALAGALVSALVIGPA
jgi:MinD-like ATPase involved in chromosome partitioning or flagellar assembly